MPRGGGGVPPSSDPRPQLRVGGASGRQPCFRAHGRVPVVGGPAGVGVRHAAQPRVHEDGHVEREQAAGELANHAARAGLAWLADWGVGFRWRGAVDGIAVPL